MNEIKTNNFDYSVLDSSTAEYLKDRENSLSKTLENTAEKLGEDLFKAQQKLANHNGGVFEEWYTALGFKKQNVYNFINRHKYVVQQLDNPTDLETFQELPARMKNEMSKPSANPKVNKAVFDGDVKTHNEYKELERQLKQREQENDILQKQLEQAENKPPEVIERYTEPEDYQLIKNRLKESEDEREKLRGQLQNWHLTESEREEKSRKYDELNEAINAMDLKLSNGQLRLRNRKFVNDLITQSRILMRDITPLVYTIENLHHDDLEQMNESLRQVSTELYKISMDIKDKLNEEVVINE